MTKLLNYRKFHSEKKNADYCIITILREPNVREIEQGLVGDTCAEEIFLPSTLVDKVKPDWVGNEIALVYTVQGGKAYLEDIEINRKGGL